MGLLCADATLKHTNNMYSRITSSICDNVFVSLDDRKSLLRISGVWVLGTHLYIFVEFWDVFSAFCVQYLPFDNSENSQLSHCTSVATERFPHISATR